MNRQSWRTRFGFYILAMGSAFGLGNIWRFPYIVGENGGGAFVLLYVLLSMTVGLTLLIAELMFGQATRKSVVMATAQLFPNRSKRIRLLSYLPLVLSLVVLSYYSVITGWVLHFMSQFAVYFISKPDYTQGSLSVLMKSGGLQWGLASVHILVSMVIAIRGLQDGIERWIGFLMPFFAVIVVSLIYQSISMTASADVLRVLFYPDFSKLTLGSLNHAIGHVFFTLSVGFGTLITFGSYIKSDQHLPTLGFRVTLFDMIVSMASLLLVLPLAMQASSSPLTDPALLFDVLPRFFVEIPGGVIFGFGFFLCLYLAALNASLGLFETIVSNLVDVSKGLGRTSAAWLVGLFCLLLTIIPAFGSGFFSDLRLIGFKSMLELIDGFLINWFLPFVALGTLYLFHRGLSEKEKKKHFVSPNALASHAMYPYWLFSLRWIVPGVILLGWILQLTSLIKNGL